MNPTTIEWVRNPDGSQGYTWNPLTGCLYHDNGICRGGGFPCYAYRLAHGRLKHLYLRGALAAFTLGEPSPDDRIHDPFYPRWQGEVITAPLRRRRPSGIFALAMGDLFGVEIRPWLTERVMRVVEECRRHRFYLLTKQPQNLAQWSPFPPNAWVGVTVTRRQFLLPAIIALAQVQATVKYLSCEPLLEDIGLTRQTLQAAGISWVIIGGQTHPTMFPSLPWETDIIAAARAAGAAVFCKSNIGPDCGPTATLRTLQEFPEVKA